MAAPNSSERLIRYRNNPRAVAWAFACSASALAALAGGCGWGRREPAPAAQPEPFIDRRSDALDGLDDPPPSSTRRAAADRPANDRLSSDGASRTPAEEEEAGPAIGLDGAPAAAKRGTSSSAGTGRPPRQLYNPAAPKPAPKRQPTRDTAAKPADEDLKASELRAAAKYGDQVAVSQVRERAIDLLVGMAGDNDPQVRGNALEAMAQVRTRVEPIAAAGLKDRNEGVRAIAAMVVGRAGLTDLAPAVRPLTEDPSPFAKAAAIYALTKIGADTDPTPLASMLLRNPAPRVRAQAAFILGELGNKSALPMLHRASRTPVPRALQEEVRVMELQMAEAMVKLGEEDQLETIRAALYPAKPEDLEAAALAAQILGQLGDKSVIDTLIRVTAAWDKDRKHLPAEVRLAAAASLARLGLTQGSFIADEFVKNEAPALRAQAAFVYGEIGRIENLGKLEGLLSDPQGIVRVSAANAVVRITSRPAERAGR